MSQSKAKAVIYYSVTVKKHLHLHLNPAHAQFICRLDAGECGCLLSALTAAELLREATVSLSACEYYGRAEGLTAAPAAR